MGCGAGRVGLIATYHYFGEEFCYDADFIVQLREKGKENTRKCEDLRPT